MITSREIRELLERNPGHLFYIISTVLDLGMVKKDDRGAWLLFELFIERHLPWSWDDCHDDYIRHFGGNYKPDLTRHAHFTHPDPVAYTRRLIKYAYKLGYPIEASLCAAALRDLKLWELPFENHVSVRR
jgi:hypothetical protein